MRLLHARHDHGGGGHGSPQGADLDERTIREELEGNLCRCTGYHNIVKAVAAGARDMGAEPLRQAAE
jgi:carbon-monoxide dehydrogenase small subunit